MKARTSQDSSGAVLVFAVLQHPEFIDNQGIPGAQPVRLLQILLSECTVLLTTALHSHAHQWQVATREEAKCRPVRGHGLIRLILQGAR
jgi:hypothetical protein